VTEALEERAHMLYAAPFMVKPLPIMIPVYKWWEVPYMWIGAKAYDFVSGSARKVPRSRFINRVRCGGIWTFLSHGRCDARWLPVAPRMRRSTSSP
jgi:glycerol-3-phosphate dehydrogenase